MPLQPPSIASTAAGQVITNSFVQANWTNGLTFALNPPIFEGNQTVLQTVPTNTWAAMTLDATQIDSYGGHSNTVNNSRYVAKAPGWYWAMGYVAWANAGATCRFDSVISYNGFTLAGSSQFLVKPNADLSGISASTLVFMNVGDYLEVWGRQLSGGNLNTFPGTDIRPCLNVYWVHV